MAVAEDILKDPYFADLDVDLSQFSEEEKTIILGVMQKAKVSGNLWLYFDFVDCKHDVLFDLSAL